MNKKNLTGQRFGKLTAIAPTDKRRRSSIIWKCACDCGKECEVPSSWLISGAERSCGCLQDANRRTDITGERRGKLTALYPTDERRNGSTVWVWRCDCGAEVRKAVSLVKRSGSSTMCPACARKLKAEQAQAMVDGMERYEPTGAPMGYVKGLREGKLASNNTSGVRGVTWNRRRGKWLARISVNGRTQTIGYYDDLEKAAEARAKAVQELYGEGM